MLVNTWMLLKYIVHEKFHTGNKTDHFTNTGHSESTL